MRCATISELVFNNYNDSFQELMDKCKKAFPDEPEERFFIAIRAVYHFMKEYDGSEPFIQAYSKWWATDWQYTHIIRPIREAEIREHEKKLSEIPTPPREPTEEEIAEAQEATKFELDLPPMRERVSGFAKAMTQFAKSGFELANDEVYNRRLAKCADCDALISAGICIHCGCYMKLKAKLAAMKCPLEKW